MPNLHSRYRSKSKLFFSLLFLLGIITILAFSLRSNLFGSLLSKKTAPDPTQNTTNLETNENEYDEPQAKNSVFGSQTSKVKGSLIEKNGWDKNGFKVNIVHIDNEYIAGEIDSSNSSISEGIFLVKNTGNYQVVFDSTTSEPCRLLEEGTFYPDMVAAMCNLPTQTHPTPTNAPEN